MFKRDRAQYRTRDRRTRGSKVGKFIRLVGLSVIVAAGVPSTKSVKAKERSWWLVWLFIFLILFFFRFSSWGFFPFSTFLVICLCRYSQVYGLSVVVRAPV